MSFSLVLAVHAQAQKNDISQLAKAQEAVLDSDWVTAETLLLPLAKSQAKNPFVFYNLAQVYENTNRLDLAKQLYQKLADSLNEDPKQYTLVVRAPPLHRLVSLTSLVQTKLNALGTKSVVEPTVATKVPSPAAATSSGIPQPTRIGVTDALRNWATAWANKDMAAYYASYAADFRGDFLTNAAWRKQRLTSIARAQNIEINFQNIEMTQLSATQVQVQFLQSYRSNMFNDRVSKAITLSLSNGRWLIDRELVK